jgi:TDG/mug DNA glycosylase family protein
MAKPQSRAYGPPLADCVIPPVNALFVGINPGVRSAAIGHHFAGYSNRFWTLLFESGLVPERLRAEDDGRLPAWGYGVTNLIPRCTPGIDALAPDEYRDGLTRLTRKIKRWKPEIVVLVGVTLCRFVFSVPAGRPVALGLQDDRFEGVPVFVLPNPSGRNANYSSAEMLEAFRALNEWVRSSERRRESARS